MPSDAAKPNLSCNANLRLATFMGYNEVIVETGQCRTKKVVPPAGEKYAYDRQIWDHTVTVSISPTGRSVRVWKDGKELK